MVSATDRCKRALISLIRNLAIVYGSAVSLDRESPDAVVKKAYKKLSLKVHPDRGGSTDPDDFRQQSQNP